MTTKNSCVQRLCTVRQSGNSVEWVRKIYIPSQDAGRDSKVHRTFRDRRGEMIVIMSLTGVGLRGQGEGRYPLLLKALIAVSQTSQLTQCTSARTASTGTLIKSELTLVFPALFLSGESRELSSHVLSSALQVRSPTRTICFHCSVVIPDPRAGVL